MNPSKKTERHLAIEHLPTTWAIKYKIADKNQIYTVRTKLYRLIPVISEFEIYSQIDMEYISVN